MSTKRKNPYQRLKEIGMEWANKIKYAHTKTMFYYPKSRLSEKWELRDLFERTAAAEQLGYEVVLEATDLGLEVKYRKKAPDVPWEFRP